MNREWTIQRENGRSYLICEDSEGKQADGESEEWEQLQELAVPGLLSSHYIYRDGKRYRCYDITGKQCLSTYYKEREIGFSDCRSMLLSLDRLLCRMYECLLSEERLLFGPDKMYIGLEEKEIWMVYGDEAEENGQKERGEFLLQIQKFSEYLISRIDHNDDNAVTLAYQFHKYTCAESFNMGEFLSENRKCLNPSEDMENEIIRVDGENEETEEIHTDALGVYELYIPKTELLIQGEQRREEETKSVLHINRLAVVMPLMLLIFAGLCMQESPRLQILLTGAAAAYAGGIAVYYFNQYQRRRLSGKTGNTK